jgi:hypothetical protein
MRAAGVNIKGGHVLFAVLEGTSATSVVTPVSGVSGRISSNQGLPDADRLADLKERVLRELRAARVEAVGLVRTRQYAGWKYKDAYARIVAICAVMVACTELRIAYDEVATSDIAKVVGVPASDLRSVDSSQFALLRLPMYWGTGLAEAYCAAATVLRRRKISQHG